MHDPFLSELDSLSIKQEQLVDQIKVLCQENHQNAKNQFEDCRHKVSQLKEVTAKHHEAFTLLKAKGAGSLEQAGKIRQAKAALTLARGEEKRSQVALAKAKERLRVAKIHLDYQKELFSKLSKTRKEVTKKYSL